MSRFNVLSTSIPGLVKIERKPFSDVRGAFSRLFCAEEFSRFGWQKPIVQINHSITVHRGVLRGMHFQYPPHTEMKLVSCLSGEVWDVAVDIRASSPTFLQWYGTHLSVENGVALLIPEGFAHGFQTLTHNTVLLYCHSSTYCPEDEGGLNPEDPKLLVKWPLPITEISQRDRNHPLLQDDFKGVIL